MIIEINKDIEKFKETVFFGLTAKQSISALLSLVVGSTMVYLLQPYIGLVGSAYIAVPIVAPIALGGFYSCNGMSFFEVWKRRFKFLFANKPLLYVSTEDGDKANEAKKELLAKQENEYIERYGALKKRKGKGKMIRIAVIAVVLVTLAIMFWMLYGKELCR